MRGHEVLLRVIARVAGRLRRLPCERRLRVGALACVVLVGLPSCARYFRGSPFLKGRGVERTMQEFDEPSLLHVEGVEVYRMYVLAEDPDTYMVVVTRPRGSSEAQLVAKVLRNGYRGRAVTTGRSTVETRRVVTEDEWSQLVEHVNAIGYWRLPTEVESKEIWLHAGACMIEGRTPGSHHAVWRGDQDIDEAFAGLCEHMFALAGRSRAFGVSRPAAP